MPGFWKGSSRAPSLEKRFISDGRGCQKTHGELERAEALSIINRARRRVRREGCLPEGQASRFATGKAKSKISVCRRPDDFCGGKSHFPEQKSLPCRFCARGFRRNPSKICKAENPKGFQVSPKAKLPTAKSKILTRHRGGGRKAENPKGFQVLPLAKLPRLKSKI